MGLSLRLLLLFLLSLLFFVAVVVVVVVVVVAELLLLLFLLLLFLSLFLVCSSSSLPLSSLLLRLMGCCFIAGVCGGRAGCAGVVFIVVAVARQGSLPISLSQEPACTALAYPRLR